MPRLLPALSIAVFAAVLAGCGQDPAAAASTASTPAAAPASATPDDARFLLAVDGQNLPIDNADVLVTSQPDGSLRIFAGPDGAASVILTIPDIAACPCTVPAGSTTPGTALDQGAVSLQNHPERGNALNSWYVGQPGTPPAAAITITDTGRLQDGARYISGAYRTTVLRTESNGDGPGNRDMAVEGAFRVRHEPRGGEF